MPPIFHIALGSDWAAAQEAGAYLVSTRGRTLAEEGFIHCSRADQWPRVRDAFYADVTEPLLLLQIDPARLDVPLVEEPAGPGSAETFPHLYGPLSVSAVVKALPLPAPAPAAAESPVVPAESPVVSPESPVVPAESPVVPAESPVVADESGNSVVGTGNSRGTTGNSRSGGSPAEFSSMFLREVFVHLLIASIALAGLVVGIGVGAGVGEEVSMLVGAGIGLAAGLVAAAIVYRRYRARPTG